jgi:hypothetical protein
VAQASAAPLGSAAPPPDSAQQAGQVHHHHDHHGGHGAPAPLADLIQSGAAEAGGANILDTLV